MARLEGQPKAFLAAQAALAKHAEGVVVMDLRALSTVTEYFVICTAESPPQMTAITEQIERVFAQRGCAVWHVEGAPPGAADRDALRQPQWVLMDCGDVVVHLLNPAARALYRLEEMWADAPRLAVPPDPAAASVRSARSF